MTRIVTVTLNPALDITYDVPALRVGGSVRVGAVRSRAGGKGVNVASVVRALGGESVVIAPGALTAPDPFRDGLDRLGLPYRLVPAVEAVRQTIAVVGADGATTMLLEPGRPVADGVAAALADVVAGELAGAGALVVSGSLPPGLPDTLPARLAALAGARGVPSIVDVSGAALHAAPASGAVLTPNRDELTELAGLTRAGGLAEPGVLTGPGLAGPGGLAAPGRPDAPPTTGGRAGPGSGRSGAERSGAEGLPDATPDSLAGVVALARRLVGDGAAAVVVTLGDQGAVAVTAAGTWLARTPAIVDGNPTGAGDAAAAALALHLASGDVHWPAALADAVATSAACVLRPVAGEIDLQARARWRDTITVEELT